MTSVAVVSRRRAGSAGDLASEISYAVVTQATAPSGETYREIAAEMFLSEKTVERHMSSIFGKLGARSRVDVARELERSRDAGG